MLFENVKISPGHYVVHKNSRWGPLRGVTQLRAARGIGSEDATCLLFWSLSELQNSSVEQDPVRSAKPISVPLYFVSQESHRQASSAWDQQELALGRRCIITNRNVDEAQFNWKFKQVGWTVRLQAGATNHIRGRASTGNTESRKWPKLQLGKPKGMHVLFD